jgi:hypothetical protein
MGVLDWLQSECGGYVGFVYAQRKMTPAIIKAITTARPVIIQGISLRSRGVIPLSGGWYLSDEIFKRVFSLPITETHVR